MINWHGMDKATQDARNLKSREIRTCRKYLARAKMRGLSEKSTTVRKWTNALQYWRGVSVYAIAEKFFNRT